MPGASAFAAVALAGVVAGGSTELLRLQDPELRESSGLAVSARHADTLWTHADGGTMAQLRAVDTFGATVAVVTLAGVDPFDPEALAPLRSPSGRSQLLLADIGDNSQERDDISVFRLAEPPRLTDQTVPATHYRFAYPDGPHDAEALLVHPRTGRLSVVTKGISDGAVYRAPRTLVTADAGTNRLTRVGDAPSFVTDGAYLPDGRFALRTYTTLHVYDRPGEEVARAALPVQPQGESLAVLGDRLAVGSEGVRSAVYVVPVPQAVSTVTPEEAPALSGSKSSRGSAADAEADGWRDAWRVARAIGIVIVLVAIVIALRRTRRH